MNPTKCERELEVLAALRKNSCSPQLRLHIQSCIACAEMESVMQMLLQTSCSLQTQINPPAAAYIWREAQRRKQELALQRATLPLKVMWLLSILYIPALSLWLLRSFSISISFDAIPKYDTVFLFGVISATILIILGLSLFIFEEKQSRKSFFSFL